VLGTLVVDGCLWSLLYCTQTYAEPISSTLPPQWSQPRSKINVRNGFIHDDTGSQTTIDPRYRGMDSNAKYAKAINARDYIKRYNEDPNSSACESYWGHQGRKIAWRYGWRSFYLVTILLIVGLVILVSGLGMSLATLPPATTRGPADAMGFIIVIAVVMVCFPLGYIGFAFYKHLRSLRNSS
jgi:hypothetical protein